MEYSNFFYSLDDLEKLNEREEAEGRLKMGEGGDVRKYRFFVRPGESSKVVFLDDIWFVVWEHRFTIGKDRYNYETCIDDVEGECPLCDAGVGRYVAVATTVLNLWKDKEGKFRVSKKLLVAKRDAKDRLVRRQNALGGLKGKVFVIYRDKSKTSNSVGTDIEYEKDIDLSSLKEYCPKGVEFEEWIKPYNYPEIFKPKSVDALKKIAKMIKGASEKDEDSHSVEENLENIL